MNVSVLDLTAIVMVVAAWRPSPSVAVTGMFFPPGVTEPPTATVAVNVCSPVLALAPADANVPVAPMPEKSPVTVMFESAGFVPRFTTTVKVTLPPWAASVGSAAALVIEGGVDGVAQLKMGDAVLCGVGAPVAKSTELTSVSVQPLAPRIAAVVLLSVAVGDPSEQLAAVPKPTKSTTLANGQEPVSAVVLLTSATLPADADIAIPPVASGARFTVPPAPAPSCTR